MSFYNEFVESLLPGNYALTKSMELTKAGNCGTLWYVKKFLVLYYFIFLTDEIFFDEYIQKIIKIFDNYIDDLDDNIKEQAIEFFYTNTDSSDFKSTYFKSFIKFAPKTNFENAAEKNEYYNTAKKYYFSFLMGSGGQSGIKKKLKEKIQSNDFTFTNENLDNAIYEAAIDSAYENMINEGCLSDLSLKYVFSKKALDEIEKTKNLTKDKIRSIMNKNPINCISPQMKNDTHAFLRNERQILYYYGFFHSKTSGAKDLEFSSLTPIGQMALNSNAKEFLAIWEHQKIKMISQPVTVDINDLPKTVDSEKFHIGFTPYLDILEFIKRNKKLTLKQYKFILSRKNHLFDKKIWNANENELLNNIDSIERKIYSWDRTRDIKDEDSRKELLKYLLGIRSDLTKDNTKNTLNVVSFKNEVKITNQKELDLLCNIYSEINKYKIKLFEELFIKCEEVLQKKYKNTVEDIEIENNERIKIQWDLYNIRSDCYILMGVLLTHSIISNNLIDAYLESITHFIKDHLEEITEYMYINYKMIVSSLGLNNQNKIKRYLLNMFKSFNTGEYDEFVDNPLTSKDTIRANYRTTNNLDLMTKLKQTSIEVGIGADGNRIRKTSLINMLKSYYMNNYLNNKTLHCECCGLDTFITESGEPYLEFHHLIPFSIAYGPDHYLNLYGLCPNCHRKIHFLSISDKIPEYKNININNYFKKNIVERLLEIKEDKMLASYHLEYLLAENAITEEEYNKIAG